MTHIASKSSSSRYVDNCVTYKYKVKGAVFLRHVKVGIESLPTPLFPSAPVKKSYTYYLHLTLSMIYLHGTKLLA